MGIVDLGCADSMGGAKALDAVAQINMKRHGETRLVEVALDRKPIHSSGDGERGRARGEVRFQAQAGEGPQGHIRIIGFDED
eukprot:4970475-Pyramimonas_sp.AAC.1